MNQKSKVMTIANRLVSKGYSRPYAMMKAWILVKAECIPTRVAGVTYNQRQKVLQYLSHCEAGQAHVSLKREQSNAYDRNAVAVWVNIPGKGNCRIGHLPKLVAHVLAPILDKGEQLKNMGVNIVGGFNEFVSYGARVQLKI